MQKISPSPTTRTTRLKRFSCGCSAAQDSPASPRCHRKMIISSVPLIEMSRADILHYLKDRRITFREDASNADPRYLRNRIRHELIPSSKKFSAADAETARGNSDLLLGDDYALLEQHPSPFSLKRGALGTEFSAGALLSSPEPLLRRELRTLLRPFWPGKIRKKIS